MSEDQYRWLLMVLYAGFANICTGPVQLVFSILFAFKFIWFLFDVLGDLARWYIRNITTEGD